MGVKGLTTYLKEHAAAVSYEQTFEATPAGGDRTPLVIDAWGLIYALLEQLPRAYGGEHLAFGKLVKRTIEGWRAVGFEVILVLDGPSPPQKFKTEVDRVSALLHEVFLFHHTSALSRSHPSSLRRMRLLPPLMYSAFVDVALALGVECIWAEGEADDVVAFVASARGGFVVGLDSDFVVYTAERDGHERGYIPINSIRWEAVVSSDEDDSRAQQNQQDDDGFQVVKASKRKARDDNYRPASPVPPFVPHPDFLVSMTCTVFTPALLAASLQLPVRLLPLFASLVGNDYVNFQSCLQHRGASSVDRVERVARCLREAQEPRKGVKVPDSLTELLDRTVRALLVQSLSEADMDRMIHTLIDSALLYTLPATLPPSLTPSADFISAHRAGVEHLYLDALSRGEFAPKLSGVVRDGRYVVRPWLEDTTKRSVARIAGDGVRAAWVAVLSDSLGVGWVEPVVAQAVYGGDDGDDEDDDEQIDGEGRPPSQEESLSDADMDDNDAEWSTAAAGTVDEGANIPEEMPASSEPGDSADDRDLLQDPHVLVYHRSSAIVHPSLHPVPTLASVVEAFPTGKTLSPTLEELEGETSVVSQPLKWRVDLYLALLGSLTPAVRELPDGLKPIVAALRWMIHSLAQEGEKGTKARLRRPEIDALVLGALRSIDDWRAWLASASDLGAGQEAAPAHPFDRSVPIQEITNRSVHVTSHLLHTLHETDLLRQALLIPSATLPRAHCFYSGKRIHALLAESHTARGQLAFESAEEKATHRLCVAAILDGESAGQLCPEPEPEPEGKEKGKNQRKKEAKKARQAQEVASGKANRGAGVKRGFELLGEVDA